MLIITRSSLIIGCIPQANRRGEKGESFDIRERKTTKRDTKTTTVKAAEATTTTINFYQTEKYFAVVVAIKPDLHLSLSLTLTL